MSHLFPVVSDNGPGFAAQATNHGPNHGPNHGMCSGLFMLHAALKPQGKLRIFMDS